MTLTGDMIDPYLAPDGQEAIVLKPGVAPQLRAQLYALAITPSAPAQYRRGRRLTHRHLSAPSVTSTRPVITVTRR